MDLETGLNLLLHAVSSPAERRNSSDRASQASPASSGSIESDSESVTLDGDSDVEGDQTGPSALGGGPVVADTDIEEVEEKKRKIIQGILESNYLKPGPVHDAIVKKLFRYGTVPFEGQAPLIPSEQQNDSYAIAYLGLWIQFMLNIVKSSAPVIRFIEDRTESPLKMFLKSVEMTMRIFDKFMAKPKDRCNVCNKSARQTKRPLLDCGECHRAVYCSQACHDKDQLFHPKICFMLEKLPKDAIRGSQSAAYTNIDNGSDRKQPTQMMEALLEAERARNLDRAVSWFKGLPRLDAYNILIDTYRQRLDDEYQFEGTKRGLYAGGRQNKPIDDFRRFLDLAGKAKILPHWWNQDRQKECERRAEGTSWNQLMVKITCDDQMVDHYKDQEMPFKVRFVAERIYGREVGLDNSVSHDKSLLEIILETCDDAATDVEDWSMEDEFGTRITQPPAMWDKLRTEKILPILGQHP